MIELLNRLFESREVAHAMHLKTGSFAGHTALQVYYEGIVAHIDLLAETYQGQYGIIGDYQLMGRDVNLDDPIAYFEELVNFVKAKRKVVIGDDNEHLITIFDDITILQYGTLYKLKNLR